MTNMYIDPEEKNFLILMLLNKLIKKEKWFDEWSTKLGKDEKKYFNKYKLKICNDIELCECCLIKLGYGGYHEVVVLQKRELPV